MKYENLQHARPILVPAVAYHEPFIVYKWLVAQLAIYHHIEHCKKVWEMLSMVHQHGQSCVSFLPKLQMEQKWLRRLRHFQYNLYAILQAMPELEQYHRYFQLLLFPNEIMREWLFFYGDGTMPRYLHSMTLNALVRWPILYEQVERLV